MASIEPDVRIFENKDGDTRRVTSESGAVAARFDGYTEVTGKTKTKTAAATTGAGGAAATNAG